MKKNMNMPFKWLRLKEVPLGIKLFAFGLIMLVISFFTKSAAPLMALGFVPAFKLDGLDKESDEYKMLSDLNKRFKSIDGLTEDQAKEIIGEAMKKFDKVDVAKLLPLLDAETGFAALKANVEKLDNIIKAQGEAITAMKGNGGAGEAKNVRYYVAKWFEENKNQIAAIKAGNKEGGLRGITIPKAAITMTEATSLNGSSYLPSPVILPGVVDLARVQPTFWDRLRKGALKANPLIWVNKYNRQGNAVFTSEGSVKTLISFELQTESSAPRKIPAKMKVSREMLDDIDYLASLIEGELRYEVDKLSNSGVLTGDGIAPNPKGVTIYAGVYSLATINGVLNPNNSDAIRAAIAQIRLLFFDGPLTAFVNPADAAVMDLQKSSQGVYVLPPFTTADGRTIAGCPVVEDNNIAAGYLLIGDMSKYKVYMHEDFFIEWGWVNDDFEKNLVTVIGERRFHAFVSGNETGAFLYDTFNNIKTAIA
jgi:hypothetical protein